MAVDKLSLYNNALLLLGQRSLASLLEDREPRHLLDGAYDLEAVNHCLELVRPRFAAKTAKLTVYSASNQHDLDNVFALPSDYVSTIAVYSDPELTEEVSRYIIEGSTIACDYSVIYLRYTSSASDVEDFSPSFALVVSAFLASQIAIKVDPDKAAAVTELFRERVKTSRALEEEKDPKERAPSNSGTLTNSWRHIYNDALQILGQKKITTNTEDSHRRAALDTALDSDLVADMLEETGWVFALVSEKIQFDPSAEPAFGYRRAHAKPLGLHRLHGIFQDEYMRTPLRLYMDEEQYWFSDLNAIYVQYVNRDWLTTPDNWPAFFKRLVAAKMALDAAPALVKDGASVELAMEVFKRRRHEALANDAVSAPPKIFGHGSWVGSRWLQRYRGRP